MILRSPLRRAAAVLAGAVLTLTGVMAPAAPAGAAGPVAPPTSTGAIGVRGDARCDGTLGKWVITWTITNGYETDALIDNLETAPGRVPLLSNGVIVKPGKAVFTQSLSGTFESVSISFTATGAGFTDDDNAAKVTFPRPCRVGDGDCAPAAEARFTHQLTVLRGRALAQVALAAGVLLCADEEVTLVSYLPRAGQAAELYDHQTLTIGNQQREIGLFVGVPECQTQVALFFGASADITTGGPEYGDRLLGSDAGPGARSAGPRAIYEGETPGCGEPAVPPVVTVENDCDAVTVTVAAEGTPVTAEVAYGTEKQTLTVAAGTSATATFEPGTATSVRVSYLDSELAPATVALAATSCGSPGGGGSDGDGDGGGGAAGGDERRSAGDRRGPGRHRGRRGPAAGRRRDPVPGGAAPPHPVHRLTGRTGPRRPACAARPGPIERTCRPARAAQTRLRGPVRSHELGESPVRVGGNGWTATTAPTGIGPYTCGKSVPSGCGGSPSSQTFVSRQPGLVDLQHHQVGPAAGAHVADTCTWSRGEQWMKPCVASESAV